MIEDAEDAGDDEGEEETASIAEEEEDFKTEDEGDFPFAATVASDTADASAGLRGAADLSSSFCFFSFLGSFDEASEGSCTFLLPT